MQDGSGSTPHSTPDGTAATAQTRLPDQQEKKRKHRPLKHWPGLDEKFTLGQGVEFAVSACSYQRKRADPVYRPLKIYTMDPSTRRLDGATAVINVPYEDLKQGPAGVRFAIKPSKAPFEKFEGVDLDEKSILIRNGRDPAPSDPAFHHQMVYAVCSSVYAAFRTALGRELAWAFREPQLQVFPHGAKAKNAAYSRDERSLSFGWFEAEEHAAGRTMPKQHVFACLSHDIITHELTHALLDGLRAQFGRSVSLDTSAFHEAFADLIALFQRFSYQEVVKSAIRRTGGRLDHKTFPLQLANEFGQGLGLIEGLRNVDLNESPQSYPEAKGIYEIGTVLVSAIFDAFLTIYKRRSAGYFRLAHGRGGADGEPSSELVEVLAHLLSTLASQFLSICIRAIDYCPPVNITLGEYLRALITADSDLVPDDPWAYREALIEAFGKRRIYPPKVHSLGEDALLWHRPKDPIELGKLSYFHLKFAGDPASPAGESELRRQACVLGKFVTDSEEILLQFGLAPAGHEELKGHKVDLPCIESVRSSRRVGPDGQMVFDLVAEITQCRHVPGGDGRPASKFYGGSTVILDPRGEIRYVIKKSVLDNEQLEAQRKFELEYGSDQYSFQLCHLARETRAGGADKK